MTQSRKEKILEDFDLWLITQSDGDLRYLINPKGKLDRSKIAKAIGCSRSAIYQNTLLKDKIDTLEKNLSDKEVVTKASATNIKKTILKTPEKESSLHNKKEQVYLKRISELEQEVLELKVKLKRFREVGESLTELGILIND